MKTRNLTRAASTAVTAFILTVVLATPVYAEDNIEKAGVAVALTAGNMWFVPLKAVTASVGVLSGAMSFVLSGGNEELTKQIWRDTLSGPYVITPELAKQSIGERPELVNK